MTQINIDLEEILKQAFIEHFDYDRLVDALSTDICQSNPDWWRDEIIDCLKDVLIKTIKENDDFVKQVIRELVDENMSEDFIQDVIENEVRDRVRNAIPQFEVKVKKGGIV